MQYFLLGLLLSLPALASTLQSSYDCSAIQAGNSQYNLSALGGDYEIDGVVNDGTTKMAYLINICEDLNSAFCSQGVFCPTYGNVWATWETINGRGEFTLSSIINTRHGRPHPHAVRPEAKQLEGREGLTLEFFSDRGFTPRGVTVIDFVCDPDSSGLEGLKRTGHNPDWVGKGDDQNDTQRQTPSLRLLDWTQDKNRRRLHLEWRTRLVCGSHISTISRGLVGDAFMRLGEQIRFGL